ncbi:MAG: sigma 54-interacting transcriptional regulator [Thermoanaerobaculia bacterium]
MNPRLIAISGPAEGRTFPLRGERFTIGRHAGNDLQLASLEVSRHHCELRREEDGGFVVTDLDSRHGVFVNSRPVRERHLVHSDLVTVGGSVLLFLLDDSSVSGATGSRGAEAPFVAGSTVAKKPTEMLYLDRARVDAALPAQARIARDLHALLRASTALQGPLPAAEIGDRLLAAVLEMVPAARAAVLLREPGVDELTTAAVHDGDEGFAPSRTVVEQVLRDRVGLLCDSPEDEAAQQSAGVRSLICAPLVGRDGDALGVVYADSRSRGAFDERHLELVGAVAGIASLAFENAFHLRWLEGENRRLRDHQLKHEMVGESAPMRRLLDLVARVARSDTTVLIRGESGTGKELTAQAIHRSSDRAAGPFVAINCATLSPTLLESELFGHEKGAFTGAVARQQGKLEAARGGTLFFDEVGEIPPPLQAKLLRVLQEREFERVGGTRPIRADVRVVAATNRDLEAALRDGSFRDDLYYRIKVITLETPPLRHRRDDVPLLASHFLSVHGRRLGRKSVGVSPEARRCLMAYAWPGNVRELGNVVERALVLGDSDVIHPEDLPDEVVEGAALASDGAPSEFQAAVTETKRKLILRAWRRAAGDYAAAAALLGVHVNSLHRMIRRLGLKGQLDR